MGTRKVERYGVGEYGRTKSLLSRHTRGECMRDFDASWASHDGRKHVRFTRDESHHS